MLHYVYIAYLIFKYLAQIQVCEIIVKSRPPIYYGLRC